MRSSIRLALDVAAIEAIKVDFVGRRIPRAAFINTAEDCTDGNFGRLDINWEHGRLSSPHKPRFDGATRL